MCALFGGPRNHVFKLVKAKVPIGMGTFGGGLYLDMPRLAYCRYSQPHSQGAAAMRCLHLWLPVLYSNLFKLFGKYLQLNYTKHDTEKY